MARKVKKTGAGALKALAEVYLAAVAERDLYPDAFSGDPKDVDAWIKARKTLDATLKKAKTLLP